MSDKVILALRGLIRGQLHWGDNLEAIENSLPGVKFLTLDIPGTGLRNEEPSHTTMEANVEDLRALLKEKIGSTKPHIMAMSLGGMIASCWIQKYPNDFQTAILVNTSFKGFSSVHERCQPKAMAKILEIFLTPNSTSQERKVCELTVNANKDKFDKTFKLWSDLHKKYPISRLNAIKQIYSALRFKPAQTVPEIPVLLLTSEHDKLCNFSSSKKIAKKWNCPININHNPKVGHDLTTDDPLWVGEHIEKWLQKNS